MRTVADTLGAARFNLAAPEAHASRSRRGRRPQPDADLLPRSDTSSPACRPMATGGCTP
jgi:hypothetical protein